MELWSYNNLVHHETFFSSSKNHSTLLQVTLVHPDMTREFENICKILYSERCPGDLSEETMKLFYDHTFEIGKGAQKSAKKMVDFTNNCPILNPFKIREKVEIGEEKMTCSPNVSAGCHAKFFGIISEIENKFCQVIAETDSHRIKRKQLKTLPKNYATHKFNCTKTVI